MRRFPFEKTNMPTTEVGYSEWFDWSDIVFPKKIEFALNISKLEMGQNDGSALIVSFERAIDGVIIGDIPVDAVYLDGNGEINEWLQNRVVEDTDVNGNRICLGNQGRFIFSLSQGSLNTNNPIPSVASFKVAVLIK